MFYGIVKYSVIGKCVVVMDFYFVGFSRFRAIVFFENFIL